MYGYSCGCSGGGSRNFSNVSINSNTNTELNIQAESNNLNNSWCHALRNYIGKRCSCEFQIANNLVRKTGILNDVGTNFLILESPSNSLNMLICDTSTLTFVRVESSI